MLFFISTKFLQTKCQRPLDLPPATYSPAEVWMNLEIFYKVFFSTDIGSLKCPLSESAGWTSVTLEHFEKFKMASKMAAIIGFRL